MQQLTCLKTDTKSCNILPLESMDKSVKTFGSKQVSEFLVQMAMTFVGIAFIFIPATK